MAHRIVSDEEFLATALDLFRTYGFEGVSLKQLADATGLEKASLYYRYPRGKDEIALAVAKEVVDFFEEKVFKPLTGTNTVRKRIMTAAGHLKQFYLNGTKSCLTDVLSIPGGSAEVRSALKSAMHAWVNAFAEIANEGGLNASAARKRAEDTIARIEGSLILARVLGDNTAFERNIRLLPDLLTAD